MGVQKYEFYTLSPYIFVKKCRITKKMSTFAAYLSVKRKMKKVTILVPCFNEEASLPALYEALKELMDTHSSYAWEVLMVNDGSRDNTINVIRQLREHDERICYVDLSRNFGKENAMLAGFDHVADSYHGVYGYSHAEEIAETGRRLMSQALDRYEGKTII